MGFADRDYFRQPPRRSAGISAAFGGRFEMLSITTWLIIINVAVFLLDRLTERTVLLTDVWGQYTQEVQQPIQLFGEFTARSAIAHLQVWRFITFQFLHAGPEHLLFNMIALYFFGPLIEGYLGRVRYLAFYLICGMAGPISLLVLAGLHILATNMNTPLIGASAGIFGILIAAAQVAPDSTVLIWGVLPAKLRTVAWVLLGVAVYTVVSNSNNAGGEAAHLGGAAAGYYLIRNQDALNWIDRAWGKRRLR